MNYPKICICYKNCLVKCQRVDWVLLAKVKYTYTYLDKCQSYMLLKCDMSVHWSRKYIWLRKLFACCVIQFEKKCRMAHSINGILIAGRLQNYVLFAYY